MGQDPPPMLTSGTSDKLGWQPLNTSITTHLVHNAWLAIREEGVNTPWTRWVWYSQCITRHAFILWLALKCKLKTHDKMIHCENFHDLVCAFCKSTPDSHAHIFFDCEYPARVWEHFKPLARLLHAPDTWMEISEFMTQQSVNRYIGSIIQRLTVGTMVYYIWQERNLRLLLDKGWPPEDLCNIIQDSVHLRLMGLKIHRLIKFWLLLRNGALIWR